MAIRVNVTSKSPMAFTKRGFTFNFHCVILGLIFHYIEARPWFSDFNLIVTAKYPRFLFKFQDIWIFS